MRVWDILDKSECYQKTGQPSIRGRWTDINKVTIRARVSVQVRGSRTAPSDGGNAGEGLFVAMRPLEAIKALISDVATRRVKRSAPRKLSFVTIFKAYSTVLHNDT